MKVAICQLGIEYEQKERNLEKAEQFIKDAAKQRAKLVIFPEMSFTGFSMNIELTGEDNNYTINRITEMAKKYQVAVGFGWVKHKKDAENHYTVIDKDGTILADYVKIHPFSYQDEDQYFVGGDHIVTFEFEGMTIGLTICYDLRFPEIYQALSETAQVILVPANWPNVRKSHWQTLLKARAIENQAYIVGVNCRGTQSGIYYSGESAVINPIGDVLFEVSDVERMQVLHIKNDAEEYRKIFPVKRDRRHELYRKL